MCCPFSLKNLPAVCAGFILTGIGSALLIYSGLGSDSFNVLAQRLSHIFGTQAGTMINIQEILLLLVVLLWRRSSIGLGTVLGTFLVGLSMNACAAAFGPALAAASFWQRLACTALAPPMVGMGVAMVQESGWGLVPNDIVPFLLHERAGKFQYRTVRIAYDSAMLAAGLLLGGTAGIGTVICVVLIGPCIQFSSTILHMMDQAAPRLRLYRLCGRRP